MKEHPIKMNNADWIGALRDNFYMWKVALPALLGVLVLGSVAGLAIDWALSHPVVFVAWSITCFVGGIAAHRWWCVLEAETPKEWS